MYFFGSGVGVALSLYVKCGVTSGFTVGIAVGFSTYVLARDAGCSWADCDPKDFPTKNAIHINIIASHFFIVLQALLHQLTDDLVLLVHSSVLLVYLFQKESYPGFQMFFHVMEARNFLVLDVDDGL